MSSALPIEDDLPAIVAAVQERSCVVVHAPPGAGKTTRVAPAVLETLGDSERIVLLQPRRMAARGVARRIAEERQVRLGDEVGYRVRFDDRSSRATRLLVATEGVVLRQLQRDPLLSQWSVIVFDEFHERRVETDLLLGMARRIQQEFRPELKLIVMSATLEPEPIARYLGDAPIVKTPGRTFPVDVKYYERSAPSGLTEQVVEQVGWAIEHRVGDVLVFLPGVGEIFQCQRQLADLQRRHDLLVLPLYGDLPAEEQDLVLQRADRRKVVLATNIAETSLTIEGITHVIDSGQARVMQFDSHLGLDRLERTNISKASADQRAGRAGRVAPGTCLRLWAEASHRNRPSYEVPEVARIDLSQAVLQLVAWGESDVEGFPWFEPPEALRLQHARALLERLGALRDGALTDIGQAMVRLPVQPRLARLLLAAQELGVAQRGALLAGLLSERSPFQRNDRRQTRGARPPMSRRLVRGESDVLEELSDFEAILRGRQTSSRLGTLNRGAAANVTRVAEQLWRLIEPEPGVSVDDEADDPDEAILRALLAAYPDRLACRRNTGSDKGTMVGGRGVRLASETCVLDPLLFLCVDVDGQGKDVLVRKASGVQREWLDPNLTTEQEDVFFHPSRKEVAARRRIYWDDLVLDDQPGEITDSVAAAELFRQEAKKQWGVLAGRQKGAWSGLVARLKFLKESLPEAELPEVDEASLQDLVLSQAPGCLSFAKLQQLDWSELLSATLTYEQRQLLDREAPERYTLPSGRKVVLTYEAGRPPILAAKIQELFGMFETPRLARGRVPVLLHLLAPNGRPHQVTDDLASFWSGTYQVVRKELRGRYPKHAWPEDPLTATVPKRR